MARRTERAALELSEADREMLTRLSRSATAPAREVTRAKVLLGYAAGASITQLRRDVGVSRPTIYKCIDKALAAGVAAGLRDRRHRPREPEILADAKAWVVSVACRQPKTLGFAAELWTLSALTQYLRGAAAAAGFARLSRVSRSSVWRILKEHELQPHRVRYYLERRDPEFDRKMREVLMVYREVFLTPGARDGAAATTHTVSVDEKPGIQALGTRAADLPPAPGRQPTLSRDHEYVRHGTLSILAALDLHTGEIIANVEARHRSREFIALLERLHRHYPPDAVIRVVLDNHSAHISRETMAYLATRPGRFQYVHTPKHGSWLNLIECAFSKMARTFLRHIRVASIDELRSRILQGIAEMNAAPVQFRWRNFDLDLA
ncbi:MAG: IS630 family transposase [Gammaproteobacteria bacterium]|nr:IS630 family transposase [Gammaproteobacteria bacterium]